MRFLALSPAAAWILLGAAAALILLLHLLRPPRPSLTVASVMLWSRTARERKRPLRRRVVALLLALAIGLSLALALTRPEIPAIAAPAQRVTLILDNTASMAARTADGASRWQHALQTARALIEGTGGGSQILLLDSRGRADASGIFEREGALNALEHMPGPGWGEGRIPSALLSGTAVHVVTDGVAALNLPGDAVLHSVYEPAANVGVTAFDARPLTQDPTRYEALVQIVNGHAASQRVRLLIRGENGAAIVQDLELSAGETVNAAFDVSDFEGPVAATAIARADAFALDDVAYAVIPPHRTRRVLLVSPGNPALVSALRNLPGVQLTVAAPAAYAQASAHDAVVFDRFAPPQAPQTGALLLLPPVRDWLAAGSAQHGAPRITSWDHEHPVSAGIDWGRVRLSRAVLEAPDARAAPLVLAGQRSADALVTAGEARARWVKLGFALADSNFALQPDFPVFLGNAIGWLSAPEPALVRALGSVIEVPLRNAQVRDGADQLVPVVGNEHGVRFEAPHADIYTVSVPGRTLLVAANVPGPRAALINRSRLQAGADLRPEVSPRGWLRTELWIALLLCAFGLLLIDWAALSRRVAP